MLARRDAGATFEGRTGKKTALSEVLESVVPGGVKTRSIDRLAYAHDASHYLLTPSAVVTPSSAEQVAALLRAGDELGVPLTFRSGGTSLSGQASTSGLLVDTRKHFRDIEVLDEGRRVRVRPGATVRQVNARLARFKTRLGPDPASESACTIGGVVANNSSGMACGTEQNTYRTLESAVLVLASGTVVDTAARDSDEKLRTLEPGLWQGLARLRDRVRSNPESVATIRRLFAIKNTMGYGVNSFLDYDRPVDILLHLVIGSEGTLAFIAEATFRTVPVHPFAATGLLVFDSLADATASIPALVATSAETIELLDATSLRVAGLDPQADDRLRELEVDAHAALLVEYQASGQELLEATVASALEAIRVLPLPGVPEFTSDARERGRLWHMRKGLYTSVAGNRPQGTNALLEDVAVPVENLLPTCVGLVELFESFEYEDSVIFGHAKDGNIHFMLNERFDDKRSLARFTSFTERMVDLVLAHEGTLKAEHGTGRVMAPFVRRQYGDELYEVMLEVKRICDPSGLLNPASLLNDDPAVHTSDLKTTLPVEEEVDRCVECGYCEPVCPSKDLTLTPRQRIVLRRELERARAAGDHKLVKELEADYEYDGIDTCAVDGMCQTACPVQIDTGLLVKRLRAERPGGVMRAGWNATARMWGPVTKTGGAALTVAQKLPAPLITTATKAGRAVLGADNVPLWQKDLPGGGSLRREDDGKRTWAPAASATDAATPAAETGPASAAPPAPGPSDGAKIDSAAGISEAGSAPAASLDTGPSAEIVYFPACIGTMFGAAGGGTGVKDAFLTLCERAGIDVRIPEGIASMCCGTPWKSKGHLNGYQSMSQRVTEALLAASENGRIPVVCDAASCTEGLVTMLETHPQLRLLDAVDFTARHVLPKLEITSQLSSLVIHPTCSSTRLGVNDSLLQIGTAIAELAEVPDDWGCCGFAGDRGMLHPELTASATAAETAAINSREYQAYASLNRTCEIGMTRATGKPFRHVLELLEEATRG